MFLYVLSACAHAWLLVEVNPSRSDCAELANEAIAVLVLNVATLGLGGLQGCVPLPMLTTVVAASAASVLVLGSRLTLFVHEVNSICHYSNDTMSALNVPTDDITVDAPRRERATAAAWSALLSLGVGLLLQHGAMQWCNCCGSGVSDDADDIDYEEDFGKRGRNEYGRRIRRRFTAW